MKITIKTTIREFGTIAKLVDGSRLEDLLDRIELPEKIGGFATYRNISDITLGDFIRLCSMTETDSPLKPIQILHGVTDEELTKLPVAYSLKYLNHIIDGVDKINKKFESFPKVTTDIDKRAGIEKLNFGWAGLVRKMRIMCNMQTYAEAEALKMYQVIDECKQEAMTAMFTKMRHKIEADEYKHKK